MIRTNLKIAVRTLLRNRAYSLINIGGLALGIACCLLIGFYLRFELTFDSSHEHADRIVRLVSDRPVGGAVEQLANAPLPAGPLVAQQISQVERSGRLLRATNGATIRVSDQVFAEDRFFFADPEVFDVLTFRVVERQATELLGAPGSMVLTQSVARRYFDDRSALGQVVNARLLGQTEDFVVSAVIEDPPANSHLRYGALVRFDADLNGWSGFAQSWDTQMLGTWTYLLLRPSAEIQEVRQQLTALVAANVPESLQGRFALEVQPLKDVHLRSERLAELEPGGSMSYLLIFAAIAGLVLLVACVNFVNLATAQAIQRTREVGVRKTLGARRPQLVAQYLTEALLYSLAAVVLAVGLVWLARPSFGLMTGLPAAAFRMMDVGTLGGLAAVWLVTGVASGAYPSILMAQFEPIQALAGAASSRKATWRMGLMVGQFAVATVLLIALWTVLAQVDYLESRGLGFDQEQLMVITSQSESSFGAFKQEATKEPGILAATVTSRVPGGRHLPESLIRQDGSPTAHSMPFLRVEHDFLGTFGLELLEGRSFDVGDQDAVIVSQAAASELGWSGSALGRQMVQESRGVEKTWEVIGVVADPHFESLHNRVKPLILAGGVTDGSRYIVRVSAGSAATAVKQLEAVWSRTSPGTALESYFLDQGLQRLYADEARLSAMVRLFTLLAMVVSCLGLLGLISFSVEQRTKEIGIRKVLGASASDILLLLSSRFLMRVAIGMAVGIPVAYLLLSRWLQGFAYSVDIGAAPVLFGVIVVLASAMFTVGGRSMGIALANPAESVRGE